MSLCASFFDILCFCPSTILLQAGSCSNPWNFQARILERVAIPFSRGSLWSRDQTQVAHIAGGFFTSWATREVAQLPPILCDAMDCKPPGSSVLGILQARMLEWVAISFSKRSSWPGIEPGSPAIVGRFFTIWATRKALVGIVCLIIIHFNILKYFPLFVLFFQDTFDLLFLFSPFSNSPKTFGYIF